MMTPQGGASQACSSRAGLCGRSHRRGRSCSCGCGVSRASYLSHPTFVLQRHVVVWREANTCAEQVFDANALLEERIDYGCTGWDEGRLDQVRENRHDRV